MMRLLVSILVLVTTFLFGCSDTASPPDKSVTRSVTDNVTGVTLTTRIEEDEIVLADRIWVIDLALWSSGQTPTFEPRDWESTDWSVIDQSISIPEVRDGVYHLERRTLIEPFLPDTYTIPPCEILVPTDTREEPVVVQNDPIEVVVLGVLPDQDSGELNAIPETGEPPTDNDEQSPTLVIVLAAIGLVSVATLLMVMRPRGSQGNRDTAIDLLHKVYSDTSIPVHEAFELVGKAFSMLDDRLRSTTEFEQMIRVCDEVRYSPSGTTTQRVTPQTMAKHALELLGDTPQESGGRS